jgi:hypothetical protein
MVALISLTEPIKNDFYLPGRGAGFEIKEFLKRDFYKK